MPSHDRNKTARMVTNDNANSKIADNLKVCVGFYKNNPSHTFFSRLFNT